MDNSLKSLIEAAKGVMILLPNNPVFDEVAAGLSLFLTLRSQKEISVVCSTPMIVEFNRLIGVDKIQTAVGGRNMIVTFKDYKAEAIDRVSYDIENGVFKLTIIPKDGEKTPNKDQVNIEYPGASADLVIAIGGGVPEDFVLLSNPDLKDATVAHVGFKSMALAVPSNKFYPFNKPVSSTSEVVADIIKEAKWAIDADVATNLLAGIEVESAAFTSQYVTADTFQMFADLIRAGGKKGAALPQVPPQGKYPEGSLPQNWGQTQAQPQPANPFAAYNQQQAANAVPTDTQPVQNAQVVNTTPVVEQPTTLQQTNDENPPEEWLNTPKIFTGTSVS